MKKILLLPLSLLVFISAKAQVDFTPQTINTQYTDRGIVDMNGDNLDDIISVSSTQIQVFYQQPDGSFIEVVRTTTNANFTPSWSLAAADYDRNGHADLLYGGGQGVTFMRANDVPTTEDYTTGYTEISGSQYVFSQRSNFVDINNDGHLDAYVCHDVEPSVYYINDGNGNLIYNQGGLGDYPTGGHYGSVWVDFDNDRDVDLFIAKCGGEAARRDNEMHVNNGDGTFTEMGAAMGLEDSMQTWSSAWADYDNDGDMDAWIGASSLNDGFHRLMRNNGDGTFTDVIATSGLTGFTSTDIENQTYDFDNDGFADIVSGGKILYGNGNLTFTVGTGNIGNGGFGDLNNDGFIDAMGFGFYRLNNGNSNNWIKINTIGVQSNIDGIGARVEITSPTIGTQIRDVRSGEGFGNMSTLNTHFGLGADTTVSTVTIYWPSGVVDVFENLDVNTSHDLVEGEGVLAVNEFDEDQIVVYPNPTDAQLQISNLDIEAPIYTIFDINGRRVMHGKLENGTIDVSQLTTGNYVLRVMGQAFDRNNVKTKKFSKR